METQIHTATVDQSVVLNMAADIWSIIKAAPPQSDEDINAALKRQLYQDYPEFCRTYFVAIEYMIEMRKFKMDVFKEYMHYYTRNTPRDKIQSTDDALAIQAEFLVMMHIADNTHLQQNEISKFRASSIKCIVDSANAVKQDIKRREDILKELEKEKAARYRRELLEQALKSKK